MPLKINVGVSRKVSQDYQSTGFSLNIDAELPANLVENPDGLAQETNHLFQLANDLLDEQVRQATNGGTRSTPTNGNNGGKPNRNGNGTPKPNNVRNGNGNGGNGNDNRSDRGITDAQVRAVGNMAKRLGQYGETVAHDHFGTTLSGLTVKQGSELIDFLKNEIEKQPAGAAR